MEAPSSKDNDGRNKSGGGGGGNKRQRRTKSPGGSSDRSGSPKKPRQGGNPGPERRRGSRGPGSNRRRRRGKNLDGGHVKGPPEGETPFAAPRRGNEVERATVLAVDRPLTAKRVGGKAGKALPTVNAAVPVKRPRRGGPKGGRGGEFSGDSGGAPESKGRQKHQGRKRPPVKRNMHWEERIEVGENGARATPSALEAASSLPLPTIDSASVARVPSSVSSAIDIDTDRAILPWYSPKTYVPRSAEEALVPTLMHWDGRGGKECGMMCNQPPFRLPRIRKLCRKWGVDLIQALSLRRHHIKERNPEQRMPALGLGNEADIREAAALFEKCVEEYLRRTRVEFVTEQEQRRTSKASGGPLAATPDFMLARAAHLTFERCGRPPLRPRSSSVSSLSSSSVVASSSAPRDRGGSGGPRAVGPVHWVEAKMFYGASTIEQGRDSAVGRIVSTAEKYVRLYGPGAMVFSYGCGEELAHRLGAMGVAALDAHPLDLRSVEGQQRGWCGDREGRILP